MITCTFEDGGKASLRHVTTDVIVLDETKSTILLVRRSATMSTGANKLCLPGGYFDRDETLTEGAAREVLEETGYAVTNLRLFLINDNPGRRNDLERQNVPIIFIGDAAGKQGSPDHETAELLWCDLHNLPPADAFAFDHYDIVQLYTQYLKNNFPLPVIGLYGQ